jgi:hypothetical protein
VCPRRPLDFVSRLREVNGYDLSTIGRYDALILPELPPVVPLIYAGSMRQKPFPFIDVALPLYRLLDRKAYNVKHSTGLDLARHFRVLPDARLILTGTAQDTALERWWGLGKRRKELINALRDYPIAAVTGPNFSLFTDHPRWDDLHNIKRIAICHEEFQTAGIPCALHLNARTERDWDRWVSFIVDRPEIEMISFEFATGAGWPQRRPWYLKHLSEFANDVGRELKLIVRGGSDVLRDLRSIFPQTTFLESSVYIRTVKRKQAVFDQSGELGWSHIDTEEGAPLDDLLYCNWVSVRDSIIRKLTSR